jgi:hypothetical protein
VLGWRGKFPFSIALFHCKKSAINKHVNRAVETLQMICRQQTFQLSHLLINCFCVHGSTLS